MSKKELNQAAFAATLAALLADDSSIEEPLIQAGFVERIDIEAPKTKRASCADIIDESIDLDIDISADSPDL